MQLVKASEYLLVVFFSGQQSPAKYRYVSVTHVTPGNNNS